MAVSKSELNLSVAIGFLVLGLFAGHYWWQNKPETPPPAPPSKEQTLAELIGNDPKSTNGKDWAPVIPEVGAYVLVNYKGELVRMDTRTGELKLVQPTNEWGDAQAPTTK
ncbi:MAG TPA: hypothetical protein VFB04_07695 [Terriglobales bacterium]|nr:hypothetical protein [Terriglobales bacterium]